MIPTEWFLQDIRDRNDNGHSRAGCPKKGRSGVGCGLY
jgi:hypothetical protein